MSEDAAVSIGALALPVQVSSDRFSGAAAVSLGLQLPQGRGGATPGLGLAYSSGRQQGIFGRGWMLAGLPVIGINTERGLPSYDGKDGYSSSLTGALVPERDGAGDVLARTVGLHRVERFRGQEDDTRIRFERWIHTTTGDVHWRSRDTTDSVTVYGRDPANRVADPANPARIYQWLPEMTVMASGDAVAFEYLAEDLRGGAGQRLADSTRRTGLAQRYLKWVRWLNTAPAADVDTFDPAAATWGFTAVLDYGDHDDLAPGVLPDRDWLVRGDPFSSGTAGFDLRTWRLCQRLLVFHQFQELDPAPQLVRSITFNYDPRPEGSLLSNVLLTGHRGAGPARRDRSMPPVRFDYTSPAVGDAFTAVAAPLAATIPAGTTSRKTVLVDLYGEGLPGLLQDQPAGWFFQRNLGGGRFAPALCVQSRPAHSLANVALGDIDADGNMDAFVIAGQGAGHYRFDRDAERWSAFQPFPTMPTLSGDHRVERLDLTGDGLPDLMVREGDGLRFHRSRGDGGFSPEAHRVRLAQSAGAGPAGAPPLATDSSTDYLFADMTGDGLPDQVLVRSGLVAYWPNLGQGTFGAPVVMENAPVLDTGGGFALDRVLLADLTGSGTADLIHLGEGEIRIWTNACGNGFIDERRISGVPMIDTASVIAIRDVHGDGRMALVWTESRPGRIAAYQSLALSGSTPPGLVAGVTDGLGHRQTIEYGYSALHYGRDQGTDRAWTTRLPNHLVTVDTVVSEDLVTGMRYETRFLYRNGAFDSRTRRFAGFGEVDVINSDFVQGAGDPLPASEPLLTRFFFDQGMETGSAARYWQGDADEMSVPVFSAEAGGIATIIDPETWLDARASLRGKSVREEAYTMTDSGPESVPLSVAQTGYSVRIEQAARPGVSGEPRRRPQDRAAIACFERETASTLYEGAADDPRQTHGFILDFDAYGTPSLAVSLDYPRRPGAVPDDTAQLRLACQVKRTRVLHDDTDDRLSLNTPLEQEEFTISGLTAPARGYFTYDEIRSAVVLAVATPLSHDQPPQPGRAIRSHWGRQLYTDGTGAALPFGTVAHPPRVHHGDSVVFTEDFAIAQYGAGVAPRLVQYGYRLDAGHWWRAGDAMRYLGAAGFYRAAGQTLSDNRTVQIDYDTAHLFAVRVTDPFGAEAQSIPDYWALETRRTQSPTGAWTEITFDPLGAPERSSHGGTVLDSLDVEQLYGFDAPVDTPAPTVSAALADPAAALGNAARVTIYDAEAFDRDGSPVTLLTITTADLAHDGTGNSQNIGQLDIEVAYFDGTGESISAKRRVEGGPAIFRDGSGAVVLGLDGRPALQDTATRWHSSGWLARNQKGEATLLYQPYFSDRPDYEDDTVLQQFGVPTRQFFDATGREVLTLMPDGTSERVEFTPWRHRHFDANDTVNETTWRLSRAGLPVGDPDRHSLDQTLPHAGTPVEQIFDSEGRQVRLRESDGVGGLRELRTRYTDAGEVSTDFDARDIEVGRYTHDMAGRKIVEWSADAGEIQILYDVRDNPVEVTGANGARRLTQFDALDRPLSVDLETAGGLQRIETVTYADDPADPQNLGRNLLGLVVETRDASGVHRVLDALPMGQAIATSMQLIADPTVPVDWSAAVALDPDVFVHRSHHDAAGRPTLEERADGSLVRAGYTDGGALERLTVATADGQVPETEILGQAQYSAEGQRSAIRLGNGVSLAYGYDGDTQRLTRMRAERSAVGGRAPLLQDLRIHYDPVGNVTATEDLAHDTAGGAVSAFFRTTPAVAAGRRYTYDAYYRLRTCQGRAHSALTGGVAPAGSIPLADGSGTERFTQTFTYDLSNNLTRLRHTGTTSNFTVDFWVDAASNRSRPLLGPGGVPVAAPAADFGSAGEMRRVDHLAGLEWRHDERLARAVVIDRSGSGQPDDDEQYVYDGGGNRLRKITNRLIAGGVVERVEVTYLGGGERRRIFRGNLLILERFVTRLSDGFSEVCELHRWTVDSSARETDDPTAVRFRYTVSDYLGSATLRLDETARIISYEEYLPYGQTAFMAADDAREVALKAYGFIGRERDASTGFHHVGQRYYASWLCRWISPDPAGDVDGPNLYIYALANPSTHLDVTGLQTTGSSQRGRRRSVAMSRPPADVRRAIEQLSLPQQIALQTGRLWWFRDNTGTVHFGTKAEIEKLVEAALAAGNDVNVAVTPGSNGNGNGSGGGGQPGDDTGTDGNDPEAPGDTGSGDQPGTAPDPGGGTGSPQDDNTGGTPQPGTQPPGNGTGTDPGTGTNERGTDDATGEDGTEDGTGRAGDGTGPGATPGSDQTGRGGGGTSDDPAAQGLGDAGTGRGGGTGDPNSTGSGNANNPNRRPGGTGNGTGDKPSNGKGQNTNGNGTEPGGNGTDPAGTGTRPGGQRGGVEGGVAGGHVGGELGGDLNGQLDGSVDGSLDGTVPADQGGANGAGGDQSSGSGDPGAQGGGTSGNGTPQGSSNNNPQPAEGEQRGGGPGGSQQPPTAMDQVVRVAGWWHFEFGSDRPGQSGGIPGGMGSLNLGSWGQAAYVALTVVDIALTIASFGGLAAIKAGLKVTLKVGMRALSTVGRKIASTLSVKNLRRVATRVVAEASVQSSKIFRGLAFDYGLHIKFYKWAVSKGGWREKLVKSGVGRWFLYGVTPGAKARPLPGGKFLGFWQYRWTQITNTAKGATWLDNAVHEGWHKVSNLLFTPIKNLRKWTPGGQPVFAVVGFIEETIAYTGGRLASGRLHALPFVPNHALASTYQYFYNIAGKGPAGHAMARKAMAWAVGGAGALGAGAYGIYRYVTGGTDEEAQGSP